MKIYLAVWVIVVAVRASIYSGVIGGGSRYQQLDLNATTGFNVANIQFQVYNYSLPNLLLLAGFTPPTTTLALADLATLSSTQDPLLSQMNILSAIGGNIQNINLAIPNNATRIYFTIYNFDYPQLTLDKPYTITLAYLANGLICPTCPSPAVLTASNSSMRCQCSPCPLDYIGEACQYYLQTTVAGFTRNLDLFTKKSAYFRIKIKDSPIQLTVQEITNTNAINLYVQYEYQQGQLAGKLNCFYTSSSRPYQYLVTRLQSKITIPSKGYNVLLTFQNQGSSLVSLAFVYKQASVNSVQSWTVILAACFGVLGFVVVFIVGVKVYRFMKNRQVKMECEMVSSAVVIDGRKFFQKEEIDRFFPKLGPEFLSFLSQEQTKALDREGLQCTICYDTIQKPQAVRITTCHHIFHSLCLENWLLQTLKCPQCNLIFDTSTGQPKQKNHQLMMEREVSLNKSLWDGFSQQSQNNRNRDDKTEIISQGKSYENFRVEQIESIDNNP